MPIPSIQVSIQSHVDFPTAAGSCAGCCCLSETASQKFSIPHSCCCDLRVIVSLGTSSSQGCVVHCLCASCYDTVTATVHEDW